MLLGAMVALLACLPAFEHRSPNGRPDKPIVTARSRAIAPEIPRRHPSERAEPSAGEGTEVTRTHVAEASPIPRNPMAPSAYQILARRTGRDAAAQVELALWCERQGLETERLKHLMLAILNDPDHATARGLLGQVAFRGRWRRLDDLADVTPRRHASHAGLDEYQIAGNGWTAVSTTQWRLALWCEQRGLEPEAMAHFNVVARRDPTRKTAWKRLGYREHHGRWMRPEQVDAELADLEAQRKADRTWKPLLAKWRAALKAKDKDKEP